MRLVRRVFSTLPLVLMLLLTGGVILGLRIVRPAEREIAEVELLRGRILIKECRDYMFMAFDKHNNRYRFEAWDDRGLVAAYSPPLDKYVATTATVQDEGDGKYSCLLDDKPYAEWDGELWRKVVVRETPAANP